MAESKAPAKGGLEGVTAADSAIGKIDGAQGALRYRGYLIKDLAEHSDFMETTYLLWNGELPTRNQLETFREQVRAERSLSPEIQSLLQTLAPKQAPMDCLRTVVSALSIDDPPSNHDDRAANEARARRLLAKTPLIVANYARLREGKPVIEPRADLSTAANFLYMLNGEVPSAEEEKILDVCLILHAEHGFNASTFSGRVTAATESDMYSAITSAIGTLKGPLHGGANTAVMESLLQIGSVDNVESWLDEQLTQRNKIMGFGHRVYKVVDPRALILKEFSAKLAQQKGEPKWFAMSEKLESLMKARKGIDMNVDFYSASLYYYMGIAPDLFTTLFAISRMSGWLAHVMEQQANNRLIRPMANWVGPDPRDFVPLDQRG